MYAQQTYFNTQDKFSVPSLRSSPLNNLKVSWLKSERKGLGKIEKSRWCSGGAVVPEA